MRLISGGKLFFGQQILLAENVVKGPAQYTTLFSIHLNKRTVKSKYFYFGKVPTIFYNLVKT